MFRPELGLLLTKNSDNLVKLKCNGIKIVICLIVRVQIFCLKFKNFFLNGHYVFFLNITFLNFIYYIFTLILTRYGNYTYPDQGIRPYHYPILTNLTWIMLLIPNLTGTLARLG